MAKDFWFKFCPDAWLSDEGLMSCSDASQGIFMRIMCFMSKSAERGYLLAGALVPTMGQLCRMLGRSEDVIITAINELCNSQVLSVDNERKAIDGTPLYFQKRMVRDSGLSITNSENGRLGGRPQKRNESETISETKAKSQNSLSKSESEHLTLIYSSNNNSKGGCGGETDPIDWPSRIYAAYPKKVGKPDALKSIAKTLKTIERRENAESWLYERVMLFARATAGCNMDFVPYPATWFNKGHYDDDEELWKRIGREQERKPADDRQRQREREYPEPDEPLPNLLEKFKRSNDV